MKRFIKFACVGGISFFLNLGLTFTLKEYWLDSILPMDISYIIALVISFPICMSLNYVVNHNWAFRDSRVNNHNMFKGWLKYASISAPLEPLTIGLTVLLRENVLTSYYGYLMAEATGIFVIFLVRYFLVSKLIWKVNRAVS